MAALKARPIHVEAFDEVLALEDEHGPAGFISIHSTRLGPAFGGIRRRTYESANEALGDACALARAMTTKCALAGLAAGGAKTTLIDHPMRDVEALYRALGRQIDALRGRYVCGPDVGTGEPELEHVRSETGHVNPRANRPGQSTALGVLAAIAGACEARYGARTITGRGIGIEGLGSVGSSLARLLLDEDAPWGLTVRDNRVGGWDIDAATRAAAAAHRGRRVAKVSKAPNDIVAPCALGGVIDDAWLAAARCEIVCGSANNQLADGFDARRLHEVDVFWVPDVVSSAGAVIEGVLTVLEGDSPATRAAIE